MAKTDFLQIRMTPENSRRLSRVAEADHLDESTWARRAILQALDHWEALEQRGDSPATQGASGTRRLRKVAEAKLPGSTQPRGKQSPAASSKRPARKKRGG